MANVLTTTEAASLCGVSFRTVIRWIERGELQAYKLPGRGDHRIPVTELRRFMRENRIPEPVELAGEMPRRILIAEDEKSMASAINRVLRGAGFETARAEDGFKAGLMLHSFKPGLLTLDINMPGVDGFSVLRSLYENPLPFPCKVLVVSADTTQRLDEAITLGADGALAKPFTNEELLTAVRRLFGEEPVVGE